MVRQQGGVTEVNMINLSVQEAWEHVLMVIRELFHLEGGGGFHICKTTQEICIKYFHSLLSRYFREELKQRIWGTPVPRRSLRSCLATTTAKTHRGTQKTQLVGSSSNPIYWQNESHE